MSATLALIVCCAVLPAAPPAPHVQGPTQLTYRGALRSLADDNESSKSFDLELLVLGGEDDRLPRILWTLDEQGRGQWHWTSRFGEQTLNALGAAEGASPKLFLQRTEASAAVPVQGPIWTSIRPLATDKKWAEGKWSFEVVGQAKVDGRDAWRVEVRDPYGRSRQLDIDKARRLILQSREILFLGQGERHELRYRLAKEQRLEEKSAQQWAASQQALASLRDELNVKPGAAEVNLDRQQVDLLRERLPSIVKAAPIGPVSKLLEAVQEDAKFQRGRTGALATLQRKTMGKRVGTFRLTSLEGKTLVGKDLLGHVTVLHFWQYRDKPLREPYGQVGFIDFLGRRLDAEKVKLFGVTVDPRLADEGEASAAKSAARRLKSFMRLSYPILLDDGRFLKQVGDPRPAGAQLPLVVVLDPQGKIIHYHVGLYDVDQRRGLTELADVVKAAIK